MLLTYPINFKWYSLKPTNMFYHVFSFMSVPKMDQSKSIFMFLCVGIFGTNFLFYNIHLKSLAHPGTVVLWLDPHYSLFLCDLKEEILQNNAMNTLF